MCVSPACTDSGFPQSYLIASDPCSEVSARGPTLTNHIYNLHCINSNIFSVAGTGIYLLNVIWSPIRLPNQLISGCAYGIKYNAGDDILVCLFSPHEMVSSYQLTKEISNLMSMKTQLRSNSAIYNRRGFSIKTCEGRTYMGTGSSGHFLILWEGVIWPRSSGPVN